VHFLTVSRRYSIYGHLFVNKKHSLLNALGTEVGLGPCEILLDEDPAHNASTERAHHPHFSSHVCLNLCVKYYLTQTTVEVGQSQSTTLFIHRNARMLHQTFCKEKKIKTSALLLRWATVSPQQTWDEKWGWCAPFREGIGSHRRAVQPFVGSRSLSVRLQAGVYHTSAEETGS